MLVVALGLLVRPANSMPAPPAPATGPRPLATPVCEELAWSVVAAPPVGVAGTLSGVAGAAPNDVWAVGYDQRSTVALHWEGTNWTRFPSPNPAGSYSPLLAAVHVRTPNDVWAVGQASPTAGGVHTLIEHWDGTAWSILPSPNVAFSNSLRGVTALAANDAWAVGASNGPTSAPLILHWDGSTWSLVPTPALPGGADLDDVIGFAANDVWAVGAVYNPAANQRQTLALHWDGSTWQVEATPNTGLAINQLLSVGGQGPDDLWAVGYVGTNNAAGTLALHRSVGTWGITVTPNLQPNSNTLYGVTTLGTGEAWAAGEGGLYRGDRPDPANVRGRTRVQPVLGLCRAGGGAQCHFGLRLRRGGGAMRTSPEPALLPALRQRHARPDRQDRRQHLLCGLPNARKRWTVNTRRG